MKFDWTDERLKQLRQMFKDGYTAADIAETFGHNVSRNAICGKLSRLGLTRGLARKPKAAAPAQRRAVAHDRPKLGVGAQVQAINRAPRQEPVKFDCRDAADVVPLHLSLLQLSDCTCKWPYGNGPYTFCGNPTLDGPYCYPHHVLSLPLPFDRRTRRAA